MATRPPNQLRPVLSQRVSNLCRSARARTPKARLQQQLIGQQAGLKLLLLRLALIPMNLVKAGCALGPTRLQPYALASLALIPRFALVVIAEATGAESLRGKLSPLSLTGHWASEP